MSYCRFGWGPNNEFPGTIEDGSDLYMIPTDNGKVPGIECCMCKLVTDASSHFPFLTNLNDIVEHLDAHRNAGHVVLPFVQDEIEADFRAGRYGLHDTMTQVCGDYPAPCNCDDPVSHNGHNRNR